MDFEKILNYHSGEDEELIFRKDAISAMMTTYHLAREEAFREITEVLKSYIQTWDVISLLKDQIHGFREAIEGKEGE